MIRWASWKRRNYSCAGTAGSSGGWGAKGPGPGGGEALPERIERIRQTAVRFRKEDQASETASRGGLERELNLLDPEQTLHLVRAFSYFSHLLNIAEDEQQHRRRPRARRGGLAAAPRVFGLRARARESRAQLRRRSSTGSPARGRAGAHRASDRGAAQEHPRLRARDRAAHFGQKRLPEDEALHAKSCGSG